jgi:hypothetical protein
MPFLSRAASLLCFFLAVALFSFGCSTAKQPPMPIGALKLGLANFTQPKNPSDMLAGYAPEDAQQIDQKVLNEMDVLMASVLADKSKNSFHSKKDAAHCARVVQNRNSRPQAAIRTWSGIGRCMEVDLLVVPYLYAWNERNGGSYGVVTPARVIMDVFVLDVRNESLISRSRYDETQSALSTNLLEVDKFFKRAGKWVSARDLAEEGMEKAIRELGL